MEKVKYEEIQKQQLVDIRTQYDYHAGHIENSLNLIPKNFKKYATYYLELNQPLIFIASSEEEEALEQLSTLAEELGFTQVAGYILIEDVPTEQLRKIETIPADEFLNKEEDYILLDVRHPDEITRPAPEKNLVNIPFEDLIKNKQRLNQEKEIYTLCGSGNRSTAAASYLSNEGFNTFVIDGGMKAIQEASQ